MISLRRARLRSATPRLRKRPDVSSHEHERDSRYALFPCRYLLSLLPQLVARSCSSCPPAHPARLPTVPLRPHRDADTRKSRT